MDRCRVSERHVGVSDVMIFYVYVCISLAGGDVATGSDRRFIINNSVNGVCGGYVADVGKQACNPYGFLHGMKRSDIRHISG